MSGGVPWAIYIVSYYCVTRMAAVDSGTIWQAWAGQENFEPLAEGNAGTGHPNGTTAD
jgi:hypothetical protein